jgi:hypothetical protein
VPPPRPLFIFYLRSGTGLALHSRMIRLSQCAAGFLFVTISNTWAETPPSPHSPNSGSESEIRWILAGEVQAESAPLSTWWEALPAETPEGLSNGRVATRIRCGLGSTASRSWSVHSDLGIRWEPRRWSFEPPRIRVESPEWTLAEPFGIQLSFEGRFPPWWDGFATVPPGLGLRPSVNLLWRPGQAWGVFLQLSFEPRILSSVEVRHHHLDFVQESSLFTAFGLSRSIRVEAGLRTGVAHSAATALSQIRWQGLSPLLAVSAFLSRHIFADAWAAWPFLGEISERGPLFGMRVSFGVF